MTGPCERQFEIDRMLSGVVGDSDLQGIEQGPKLWLGQLGQATGEDRKPSDEREGSAAPRRARDPARDGPQVLHVGVAEATKQRPLFVADHEHVGEDRQRARVQQER